MDTSTQKKVNVKLIIIITVCLSALLALGLGLGLGLKKKKDGPSGGSDSVYKGFNFYDSHNFLKYNKHILKKPQFKKFFC